MKLSLAILFSLATIATAQVPTHTWQVETAQRPAPYAMELIRGESIILAPQYVSSGVAASLQGATNAVLRYRSADMPADGYYALSGTATGGTASFAWGSTNCAAATNYTYTIAISGVGVNLRSYGTIKLIGSVGGTSAALPTNATFNTAAYSYIGVFPSSVIPTTVTGSQSNLIEASLTNSAAFATAAQGAKADTAYQQWSAASFTSVTVDDQDSSPNITYGGFGIFQNSSPSGYILDWWNKDTDFTNVWTGWNSDKLDGYHASDLVSYVVSVTNAIDRDFLANKGGVTGAVFAASGTTPSVAAGLLSIPTNAFGGGTGGGISAANATNIVRGLLGRFAVTNVFTVTNSTTFTIPLPYSSVCLDDVRVFGSTVGSYSKRYALRFFRNPGPSFRRTDLAYTFTNGIIYATTTTVAQAVGSMTNVVPDASGIIWPIDMYWQSAGGVTNDYVSFTNATATVLWNCCTNTIAMPVGSLISHVEQLGSFNYWDASGGSALYGDIVPTTVWTGAVTVVISGALR
jgi:hypothetical protein